MCAHYSETIKMGKLLKHMTTKLLAVVHIRHRSDHPAVNIVKTDSAHAEYVMWVDLNPFSVLYAKNPRVPVGVVHVVKHNPSGRRKQKFDFRQGLSNEWFQIEMPNRFIVEYRAPDNDKDCNNRVPDPGHDFKTIG